MFEPVSLSNASRSERLRVTVEPASPAGDVRIATYRPDRLDWTRMAIYERVTELESMLDQPQRAVAEDLHLSTTRR